LTEADAPLVAEWRNDPEYWGPFFNMHEDTTAEWEAEARKEWDRDELILLTTDRETDEPLGMIGYIKPFTLGQLFRAVEIWYQVHPSARGRGVATEAARILINHLFNVRPIERIQATVAVGNDGSGRVLERAGMQPEGVLRSIYFLDGRYHDLQMYSVVRGDWGSEASYREGRDF
jgi:RimJ/RimL family protein N-acetyltransferase